MPEASEAAEDCRKPERSRQPTRPSARRRKLRACSPVETSRNGPLRRWIPRRHPPRPWAISIPMPTARRSSISPGTISKPSFPSTRIRSVR